MSGHVNGQKLKAPHRPLAQFQRFGLALAASFTAYRLIFAVFAPSAWHIPDEILLAVMLIVMGYLWMAQTRALASLSKSEAALKEAHVGVLAALVAAVEAKDEYTRGHSEQVKRVAVALARKLDLPEDEIEVVARAAALHDLGKIETPDALLNKQAPLTPDEREVLQKHPARTAAILSSLDFLRRESRAALCHHERFDGTGYGIGLSRDDIPLESSIIGVADMFDAMNSDRPYRRRMPREKIITELQKSRDAQHPAAVIDAFLKLLSERPEIWIRP